LSSHHIVREKQEPALIVEDLNEFNEELLGQLLEWVPTLITNVSSMPMLLAKGINIDILVSNTTTFPAQNDIIIIPKTDSFLKTALNHLVNTGYSAVNILPKEIPFDLLYSFSGSINIVVLQQHKRIFAIKSGYRKWKPANESVELYGTAAGLHVVGLKREDNNRYRTITDGFYEIRFTAPHLLIAESF